MEPSNQVSIPHRAGPGLELCGSDGGGHSIGEILNYDGRIGGLNSQWAWATEFLAGRASITSS
ncbi:MAG: NAD(P)/FAD-dependent oxidoreductase [Candidatus Caldarchaeum sp.]